MNVTDLRMALRRSIQLAARKFLSAGGVGAPDRPERVASKGNYHTPFGGLWTDRNDAEQLLRDKIARGALMPIDAERLKFWIDNGFVILEGAVEKTVIDQLNRDVDLAWQGDNQGIHVEYWVDDVMHIDPISPELKPRQAKVLDLHAFSEAARHAVFAPAILHFLTLLFERKPLAFQSLCFERGTQQPMHQDAAYVVVSSRLEMAASWIALEDIQPNTGELEYYVGSHKLRPYLFRGEFKSLPHDMAAGDPDHVRFLAQLHEQAAEMGLQRARFRPRKGDALIWHADLAHGGSQEMDPNSSRKSLVTHYCPIDREPAYFSTAAHSEKIPHRSGGAYAHQLHLQREWKS